MIVVAGSQYDENIVFGELISRMFPGEFKCFDDSVFGDVRRYEVCGVKGALRRIGHGDSATDSAQHFGIVVAVSDCHDLIQGASVSLAKEFDRVEFAGCFGSQVHDGRFRDELLECDALWVFDLRKRICEFL